MIIAKGELMGRLETVRSFLDQGEASAILISDPVEVRYITGLKSSNMYLLIRKDSAIILTDFRYKEMTEQFVSQNDWEFQELRETALKEIASLFQINETISVQSNSLTIDQFQTLKELTPSAKFVFEGKKIASLFSIKNSSEIESIQNAASIADSALSEWITLISKGISERNAADLLETLCKKRGSEATSFDTIVLFGERSALPHGVPTKDRLLTEGDSILVDFGCIIDGFCSDMTRTFFFKSAPNAAQERYKITLRAQEKGIESVHPGVKASDIDTIVRTIITDEGFGEQFGHGTGHGVGLRIHEQPAINRHDTTILKEGMVITVEPGIYLPNESGVRIEDLLLVTADGCRLLSQFPKQLTIIQ